MTILTNPVVKPQHKNRTTPAERVVNGAIPPLENGDRLSRAEFERRYEAHPEISKAELIEGVVYVASPVRVRRHGAPHSDIIGWLSVYRAATPGVYVTDNSTLQLDLDNEPQPDVAVWLEGGNASVNEEDYWEGAPELIVEVAGSSAAIDLHNKLTAYRRNGVQEYLVLLAHERAVRWFRWRGGEAEDIQADAQGILRSDVLPGLYLHPGLFWQGDLAGVLAVLQQGLATPEHDTFVQRMQA
ncbi:MAG: Uma2 family endonuclease [Caldilineaceae bacterium]